jgi:hypothetical protein
VDEPQLELPDAEIIVETETATQEVQPPPVLESEPLDAAEGLLTLPPGPHDAAALEQALQTTTPFRGTVIALGFSRGKAKPTAGRALDPQETTQAVEKLIKSLLTPRDAVFPSAQDEYLLALPDETGPPAQRRLQYVSESLWDYQIRSVGVSSILFYWGSAESNSEPLSTVVAAAKERMEQTKRTRERPPSEIHHYRMNLGRN